jgi:hypothetical protein
VGTAVGGRKIGVQPCGVSHRFPYAKLDLPPSPTNPIVGVSADRELGDEAFTDVLASGDEGIVHIDHALEYNQDPGYLRDVLLYRLTLEVQRRVEVGPLSKRELIRRLGTSATQFYRFWILQGCREALCAMTSFNPWAVPV